MNLFCLRLWVWKFFTLKRIPYEDYFCLYEESKFSRCLGLHFIATFATVLLILSRPLLTLDASQLLISRPCYPIHQSVVDHFPTPLLRSFIDQISAPLLSSFIVQLPTLLLSSFIVQLPTLLFSKFSDQLPTVLRSWSQFRRPQSNRVPQLVINSTLPTPTPNLSAVSHQLSTLFRGRLVSLHHTSTTFASQLVIIDQVWHNLPVIGLHFEYLPAPSHSGAKFISLWAFLRHWSPLGRCSFLSDFHLTRSPTWPTLTPSCPHSSVVCRYQRCFELSFLLQPSPELICRLIFCEEVWKTSIICCWISIISLYFPKLQWI